MVKRYRRMISVLFSAKTTKLRLSVGLRRCVFAHAPATRPWEIFDVYTFALRMPVVPGSQTEPAVLKLGGEYCVQLLPASGARTSRLSVQNACSVLGPPGARLNVHAPLASCTNVWPAMSM